MYLQEFDGRKIEENTRNKEKKKRHIFTYVSNAQCVTFHRAKTTQITLIVMLAQESIIHVKVVIQIRHEAFCVCDSCTQELCFLSFK